MIDQLPARLRLLRKENRLTQADMAAILAVSRQSYSLYEKGVRHVDTPKLERLAARLDVSLDWLLFGKNAAVSSLPSIPVKGFAKCGIHDWYSRVEDMSLTTQCPPDCAQDGTFAVIARGTSLVPEGVKPGFLCICSPQETYTEGDLVFVQDNQGDAALKVFEKEDATWLYLKGYLPAEEEGAAQSAYVDQRKKTHITLIAPVMYIKRKA